MAVRQLGPARLGYDEAGSGEDALLLIHGHPFDRSMWRAQLAAAAGMGWRAIAPDLRGYGESGAAPPATSFSSFAEDLAQLLDALGVARVALCGLSMGGQIAMEFCRLFPGRVRGLVLAATFPQAENEAGRVRRHAMADRLLREGMAPYAEEVLPRMLAPRSIARLPKIAADVLGMMRSAPPEGAAAALRCRAGRPGYEATLAALDVPALIVVGDEDVFTTRADADAMHTLLKRSELVWMAGIGHMPNLESEAEFNAALARFLGGIAGSA